MLFVCYLGGGTVGCRPGGIDSSVVSPGSLGFCKTQNLFLSLGLVAFVCGLFLPAVGVGEENSSKTAQSIAAHSVTNQTPISQLVTDQFVTGSTAPSVTSQPDYYIVQFKNLIEEQDHSFLNTHTQVLKYFPPRGYVVYTSQLEALKNNERVESFKLYDKHLRLAKNVADFLKATQQASQKSVPQSSSFAQSQGIHNNKAQQGSPQSPTFLQDQQGFQGRQGFQNQHVFQSEQGAEARFWKIKLDVAVFQTASLVHIKKQLQKLGVQNITHQDRFMRMQANRQQIEALSQLSGVEYISQRPVFKYQAWRPQNVLQKRDDFQAARSVVQVQDDLQARGLAAQAQGSQLLQGAALQDRSLAATMVSRLPVITGYETGTRLMQFHAAWAQGLSGWQQVVGVVDSGLDTGDYDTLHTDMASSVLSGQGLLGEVMASVIAKGRQFDHALWHDADGHGTHVSSTLVGRGFASPQKVFRGGAFDARLHVHKVHTVYSVEMRMAHLDFPSHLGSVFQAAYDQGVRVHNNSWGGEGIFYSLSNGQVDEFVWNHPDFVLLFAAGNHGAIDSNEDGRIDGYSVGAPASSKNVIAVGASENYLPYGGRRRLLKPGTIEYFLLKRRVGSLLDEPISDNPKGIALFSSRGPTADGRIKPDIVAPGTNILSLCSTHERADSLWGRFDEHYCYSSGTSMSTPLVSAAAAVVRQALQERGFDKPSAALIKAILLHTADDLFPGQYGFGRRQEMLQRAPNNHQGYGRVNVSRAIRLNEMQLLDEQRGVKHGRVLVYKLDEAVRKVTLVYTDAPAAPASFRALVNNLDLYVKLPSGEVVASDSAKDNVEQVVLPQPTHGVRVYVKAKDVPFGRGRFFRNRQAFAVVAD